MFLCLQICTMYACTLANIFYWHANTCIQYPFTWWTISYHLKNNFAASKWTSKQLPPAARWHLHIQSFLQTCSHHKWSTKWFHNHTRDSRDRYYRQVLSCLTSINSSNYPPPVRTISPSQESDQLRKLDVKVPRRSATPAALSAKNSRTSPRENSRKIGSLGWDSYTLPWWIWTVCLLDCLERDGVSFTKKSEAWNETKRNVYIHPITLVTKEYHGPY